jgi:hypothetical protein
VIAVPPSEFERELQHLENELKRLEAEYNMFFAGRLRKPPWDTRSRVEALVKQYDRRPMQNTAERFRFNTIQTRFATLTELWDRGLRAREEGRSGPFGHRRATPAEDKNARVMHVAAFRDPSKETDSLRHLYDSLSEARRASGERPVAFQKFADLVNSQVARLKATGSDEVAFRVAVKEGKVTFTAKGIKPRK